MDAATRMTVDALLAEAGTTYAEQAGIRLADRPMPLFQLLTFCMLASKPIDASIAVRAAAELFSEKLRTPEAVLEAERKTMIDAFGRASYARYDESSATRLVEIAQAVQDEYGGDLRRLGESRDLATVEKELKKFKGIGDTGVAIFLREVQDTWTWVRPYFDDRAEAAAKSIGLPTRAEALSKLAPKNNAKLAAALVRVSLDDNLRERVSAKQ